MIASTEDASTDPSSHRLGPIPHALDNLRGAFRSEQRTSIRDRGSVQSDTNTPPERIRSEVRLNLLVKFR